MKKPVLAIGIILFIIFVFDLKKRFPELYRSTQKPTSCRNIKETLEKRIPGNWQMSCNKNNLQVIVGIQTEIEKKKNLRALFFRELANHYIWLAKNSPYETLERVDVIGVRLKNARLRINSVSSGRQVVKLATLKDPHFVAEHFKTTVRIQEVWPGPSRPTGKPE